MIFYYIIVTIYVVYFLNELRNKRFFNLENIFIGFFLLRFYLFSPLISEGFIFKPFFNTSFNSELQNIYNSSASIILITLFISKAPELSRFRIQFRLRKNGAFLFQRIFLFFVVYTLVYYAVMGVTPPILSPFFGESTLTNRLRLTYNKIKEPIIFYGNTIIKDYLIQFLGIGYIFFTIKYRRFFTYSILTFFLISYIGRKSSIANFLIFTAISLHSFRVVSKKSRNYLFGAGIFSIVLLFFIYGSNNLIQDIGIRTFITESSFSYQLYDQYIDDKSVGINIFNFPLQEVLFGIEHYDIKKEIYEKTFPSRVTESGSRNAQGFGLLFLYLAFGKYLGLTIFFIISLLTFIILRTTQKSIYLNLNNPIFFGFYFMLLSQAINYFGVNIFGIFDITLLNFKFLILLILISITNRIKIFRYEFN